MIMVPKEGAVCFIVFLDNKNIWFGEKISKKVSISIIEKVMMISLISWRTILNFSLKKELFKDESSTSAQILSWHAIQRETNFYQPKQGYPHRCRTTLMLQTKILKHTLCPRDIFLPWDISKRALKGLMSTWCRLKRDTWADKWLRCNLLYVVTRPVMNDCCWQHVPVYDQMLMFDWCVWIVHCNIFILSQL